MTLDIEVITQKLDAIVEKYLTEDESGFVERDGYLRRNGWPKENKQRGTYKWWVQGELPPDYKSTGTVIFEYFTVPLPNVDAGLHIGDKHFGENLEKSLIYFEEKVKDLKKRNER